MRPTNIEIPAGSVTLKGILSIPSQPEGLVLFVHGSGSSRLSSRNRFVAEALNQQGTATLLFDLLTSAEEAEDEHTREWRFDIDLLTERLKEVTSWAESEPETKGLPVGYFGASTGAAAALMAAGQSPGSVQAVVSRGGRPDLAREWLSEVQAPTLLIVGGADYGVIELNQMAFGQITRAEKKLEIVPGATHLFEEPGTLEEVATLAGGWFHRFLKQDSRPVPRVSML